MKTTLREQLEAFETGVFLDSNGNNDARCSNFYDWFCSDASLRKRAINLYSKVKKFLKYYPDINLDEVCVFFKNNCPGDGNLYDSFSIVDIESGNVLYWVCPSSGHRSNKGKAEIYGAEDDFKSALREADSWKNLFK